MNICRIYGVDCRRYGVDCRRYGVDTVNVRCIYGSKALIYVLYVPHFHYTRIIYVLYTTYIIYVQKRHFEGLHRIYTYIYVIRINVYIRFAQP